MIVGFVKITGVRISADGLSVIHDGEVKFSDTDGIIAASFGLPISSLPTAGDVPTLIGLATQAVQATTGRTVDRVMISGWYW